MDEGKVGWIRMNVDMKRCSDEKKLGQNMEGVLVGLDERKNGKLIILREVNGHLPRGKKSHDHQVAKFVHLECFNKVINNK